MEDKRFYTRVQGKVLGPFNLAQLKALRDRGQFRRFHELSEDRQSWRPASTLAEVFAAEGTADKQAITASLPSSPKADGAGPGPRGTTGRGPRAASETAEWHYMDPNGKRHGPLTRGSLLKLWEKGAIWPATLVWKEGMADWLPISSPAVGLNPPAALRSWKGRRGLWIGIGAATAAGLLTVVTVAGFGVVRMWGPTSIQLPVSGAHQEKELSDSLGLVVCGERVTFPDGERQEDWIGTGSCFAVSPNGHLLTNKHVVQKIWTAMHAELLWEKLRREKLTDVKPTVWVFLHRKKYIAEILHVSDKYDLSILKIPNSGPFLKLAATVDLPRATPVTACGFPGNARDPLSISEIKEDVIRSNQATANVEDFFKDRDFEFTLTTGTINRMMAEQEGSKWVEHNAAINHGNSGGPLLTEDGTVIGINTQITLEGQGIYRALALPQLREEIDQHVPGTVWK